MRVWVRGVIGWMVVTGESNVMVRAATLMLTIWCNSPGSMEEALPGCADVPFNSK